MTKTEMTAAILAAKRKHKLTLAALARCCQSGMTG